MLRLARTVSVLAVVAAMSGCAAWKHNPSAREGVARANAGEIRVTQVDGIMVRLVNAAIVGDSLIGISAVTGARVAIPTSAVATTETKDFSGRKTAMLGGGIVLGVVALLAIALTVAVATTPGY